MSIFSKIGGKSSYMVYFASILCIFDENDAKNTKKRDKRVENDILKNPDLSMIWYPDCTPRHMTWCTIMVLFFGHLKKLITQKLNKNFSKITNFCNLLLFFAQIFWGKLV